MRSESLFVLSALCVIQLFGLAASGNYPDILTFRTSVNNIKGTSRLQQLIDHYFGVSMKEEFVKKFTIIVSV